MRSGELEEYSVLRLGGADRDLARVRLGVALYNSRDTIGARRYLTSLQNLSADADAERIYYLFQCARRLKNELESTGALQKMAELHADSTWRLQMLISTAKTAFQFDQSIRPV